MGYSTDFFGSLDISPPIKPEHEAYINKFSETRRMKRNAALAETLPDETRAAVGLPIGVEGSYFVGGGGFAGQEDDASVVNHNSEPAEQPGLWCQWVIEDGKLEWNGSEKFYNYVEWMEYLIAHFFKPWGYTLNGTIEWHGEDRHDVGRIVVANNDVSTQSGKLVFD